MTEKNTQVDWVERARAVLPAGGYGNFDPNIVIREGRGARVWGENGVEYIDYLIGSGPLILGHAHPEVVEVVEEQLRRGTTFFANNSRGIELAEEICSAVTCAQQVRYVSTGSEANMYAIRLARARTGRDKILKFEGGFHGMSAEGLMSLAPTRLQNFPLAHPDSAGIPDNVRDQVLISLCFPSELVVVDHGTTTEEAADNKAKEEAELSFRQAKKAVDEFFTEGLDNRYERHRKTNQMTRNWASKHGFTLFPENGYESISLTCLNNGAKEGGTVIDAPKLQGLMKGKGILIDGGYGKLKGKAFRLSNMGDETEESMNDLFNKLDVSMEELGRA